MQRRAEQTSPAVQAIAWQAQFGLGRRFRPLTARGKLSTVVVTAVARELIGFVWALVGEMPRAPQIPAAAASPRARLRAYFGCRDEKHRALA